MIRGLQFKINNDWNNYLYLILKSINIKKYVWKIRESEIICKQADAFQPLFQQNIIKGESFLKRIMLENYYIVNANIQAFFNDIALVEEIETYEDFLKSDCQLILFCSDSIYVEIYCKSEGILRAMYQTCSNYHFSGLSFITEANDTRKNFYVLE